MRNFWNQRSRRGKVLLVVLAVFVVFVAIAAFSGGGDESDEAAPETTTTAQEPPAPPPPAEEASECLTVPAELARGIAEGLTTRGRGTLRRARAVKSDDPEGYLISADIQAPGLEGDDDVATWSREGTSLNEGLIFAVDGVAREFSEWGAVINEGSPAADLRDAFADSDAFDQSRECVENATR